MYRLRAVVLFVTLLVPLTGLPGKSGASVDDQVSLILEQAKPPEGVVFEIIMSKNGLKKAIPKISGYVRLLRARFPGIKIAVVSHGSEQFALTTKNRAKYAKVHNEVRQLTRKHNVPVHICETHARWRGVQPEDFPKYVKVSTQGPQEVRNYQEFGYRLIVIGR